MEDNFIEGIKKMKDKALDKKLSELQDLRGISIVLQEKTERQLKKPHWTVMPTFIIVLLTMIITILLNRTEIFTMLKNIIKHLTS